MVARATVLFTRQFRHARRRFGQCGDEGFTLVELLIVMIVMMVVMVAVYTIWFGLQRTYSFTDEDMTAQEQARSALTEIVQSIRTARQPEPAPSQSLDLVIVSAEPNSLVCWTDTDRDPLHTLELVRYRVDTTSHILYRDRDDSPPYDLTFATADSVRLVSNWVSNDNATPLFSYISANGTVLDFPIADPTQIREVSIDLRIDVRTDKAPVAHQLRSMVQPRNLRQY